MTATTSTRTAKLLIDQHGQDAVHEAARRADALRDKGDPDGQAVWLRIRKAVSVLLKPGDGEALELEVTDYAARAYCVSAMVAA